jgi:hypothetical protein
LFYISLEEKIKKGENVDINITLDKLYKIQKIIQEEFNNLERKMYQTEKESKINMPSIKANDVLNIINIFEQKIENIIKGIN